MRRAPGARRRSLSGRFAPTADPKRQITVLLNGRAVRVAAGTSISAALALAGATAHRRSVTGQPRAPVCGMGICFECRVTVDGRAHQLGCQTLCADGMRVSAP